jgi:hypothetical protein
MEVWLSGRARVQQAQGPEPNLQVPPKKKCIYIFIYICVCVCVCAYVNIKGEKTVRQCLTKLNILFLYDSPLTLFGIYPNDLNTSVHTKTCTQMFLEALFIIAKIWKQPRCSSVGEWVNKLVLKRSIKT